MTPVEAAVRPMTRRKEQGAESRRRILAAASALMAERGFAGTSISSVSRRSGLPASSIYWHFESKEGLLAAVVEEGARRWFEGLPRADELPPSPAERVDVLLEATATSLEAQPEFLRLLFLIALERRDIDRTALEAIRRVRGRALAELRNLIRTLFEAAGEEAASRIADEFSVFALALADGVFIRNQIDARGSGVRPLFRRPSARGTRARAARGGTRARYSCVRTMTGISRVVLRW
jgi:AcrR family transcriptional regulator